MRPNTNKQSYNFRCEYAERKSLQQVSDTFDAIETRLKEKLWYRSIRGKIFENGSQPRRQSHSLKKRLVICFRKIPTVLSTGIMIGKGANL